LQKKYQVFVSSTFSDLVDERQDTIRSVLDLGHIPAGMEIFPAADTEQFEYIKKIIDECDYYILIIGARYGSVDTAGISFTEKEYEYALEKNIPILVFPHGETGSIPVAKSDTDPNAVARLTSFRDRATTGRLVRFWKTRNELKEKALVALSTVFSEQPGDGWVRATRVASESSSLGAVSATQTKPSGDQDTAEARFEITLPDSSWSLRQYQLAALHALLDADSVSFKKVSEAYLDSAHCHTDIDRLTWAANVAYLKLLAGQTGHLEKLVALAELHPTNSGVVEFLARAYSHLDENGRSGDTYLAAAAFAPDTAAAARLRRHAAKQFAHDGDFKKAATLVESVRQTTAAAPSEQLALLRTLLTIAELAKDEAASIVIMERLVELKPDDNGVRFNLAFKHSENGNNELALHHYLRIAPADRESGGWNNLGVAFDQFGLDVSAVSAYRQAATMDSAIARANLGNKFLVAGFLEDARSECDKALRHDSTLKNVGDLISKISEKSEQEEVKQQQVLSAAKLKMEFYRTMGIAIAGAAPGLTPSWVGPDCIFRLNHDNEKLELSGSFLRDRNALTMAGLFGNLHAGPVEKIKHTVRYSGMMQGRAFFGTVKREEPGGSLSLLAMAGSERKVCMALNEAGSEFSVMEGADTSHSTFYSISQIVE
jgi:tetratricopeptide (TPR) repeat protein